VLTLSPSYDRGYLVESHSPPAYAAPAPPQAGRGGGGNAPGGGGAPPPPGGGGGGGGNAGISVFYYFSRVIDSQATPTGGCATGEAMGVVVGFGKSPLLMTGTVSTSSQSSRVGCSQLVVSLSSASFL
jgi:hypothetical protein